MKIAFVTNFASHYRIKLFELLAARYDIKFIFYSEGDEWYREKKNPKIEGNFQFEELNGFNITKKTRITPGLVTKLLGGKYDVIIKCINGKFAFPASYLLAKLLNKKFICWANIWHHPSTFIHKISFPITRFIYRTSDALVTYGSHGQKYLEGLGVEKKKIFIAWNTVDNGLYNKNVPEDEKNTILTDLNMKGKKIILYVGRLEALKGLKYLLDAVKRIEKSDDVCCILIGDGNIKEELKEKAAELGLNNLIFLKYVSNKDLYKYYSIADVFVLPSITTSMFKEPWGLVINEAMNQGCPVVATDAVGAAVGGLVEDGKTGLVVPEKNSEKLAEAIQRILSDPVLAKSMRQNALNKIKAWDCNYQASGFINAINYVVNN